MDNNNLAFYIQNFLQDFLTLQRGYSPNTILSYRDTIKLFLMFSSDDKKIPVTDLRLSDLTQETVFDFLEHLEKQRNNSIQTRNIRLACIHSLFCYVARQDPSLINQCQGVLAIPFKRTPVSRAEYLEQAEIKALLTAIDRSKPDGHRDYTLLSLMYNTGARVAEVINLNVSALHLKKPYQVCISGKGKKTRLCPLWPYTVNLLRSLLKQRGVPLTSDMPVFLNHRGEVLTRYGVRYLINKYVQIAGENCPSLLGKRIHPHTIRHSTAMALLNSGVDINTIRAWLGHTRLETTNRYAEIDLKMKRKVLDKYLPVAKTERPWKENKNLVQWLESL